MTKAIITCLSDGARGEPLTTTRPYALIPLANKELILHQLDTLKGFELTVLLREEDENLRAFLTAHNIPFTFTLPSEEALIIPCDLLLLEKPAVVKEWTLLTRPEGSEEEEAARALLNISGITPLLRTVKSLRINYPWEFLTANQQLLAPLKAARGKNVTIEDGVTIVGEVAIGDNTVIKAGSYLEGPIVIGKHCTIGPLAHLRPDTSIGDGCTIGKTEVYDCIILPGSVSKHHAYLGHSVLGEDVNVGAFTVTADYRHDGKEHVVWVKGEKVASGRRKVGAFIGDHARLAISTSIYPGRKIPPHGTTLPGEVVQKDKLANMTGA